MRRAAALGLGLALAGCATVAPLPRVALSNPGFEEPSPDACPRGWFCATHAGSPSHRFYLEARDPAEGRSSLCIARTADEPWAIVSQSIPAADLRRATLRYSVAIRTEGVDGPGAGPWLVVHGFEQNPIDQVEALVKETRGWQRLAVEARLPAGARLLQVGLMFQGGGTVCLDDARLEIVAPAAPPV